MMAFRGLASQCEERGFSSRRDELRDRLAIVPAGTSLSAEAEL
jgi:hypothetical protein